MALEVANEPIVNGFNDIVFVPDAVPEKDLADIDLSTNFLGKNLAGPIIINAMTGGTAEAKSINQQLASLAAKYNLAMAVGSQTIALEDRRVADSFIIVRDTNPQGVLIANVSANCPAQKALQAVQMIDADGLQLHFNLPQELAMSEGDRNFKGILDNVNEIAANCPVPVIAKEVGFGFARESVAEIYARGIKVFDCSGQGGTNFIAIENRRGGMLDHTFCDWGIPTASSLAEIVALRLPLEVIASGGIRSALDAAKALALGAKMVGISGFFLKVLLTEGYEELERQWERFLYQIRATFLMVGAANCMEIGQKPLLIFDRTAQWLKLRGIDPQLWSNR